MIKNLTSFLMICFLFVSCSHSSKLSGDFVKSGYKTKLSEIWSKSLSGQITELNLSKSGSHILVSMLPLSEEREKSFIQKSLLIDADQKILWEKSLAHKVHWQAISDLGKLSILVTDDKKIVLIDQEGKVIWEKNKSCRPVFLESSEQILCFFEEKEKKSQTAFEVYDYSGKNIFTYHSKVPVNQFKISFNQKYIVFADSESRINIIGVENWKSLKKEVFNGVIIDYDVQGMTAGLPTAVVLFHPVKRKVVQSQVQLTLLGSSSKKLFSIRKNTDVNGYGLDKVALDKNAQFIVLYGNSQFGQKLVKFNLNLEEDWRRETPYFSDFSSDLTLLQNQIVLSFESEAEVLSTLRYAQMYGFDLLGETLWSIPIKGKEGSYLFDITRSSGSDTSTKMIITLEKGSISLFEAEKL